MEAEIKVNFDILREKARSSILDLLDQVQGSKTILLDPTLVGPLTLIVEFSSLQEHGVLSVKPLMSGELEQPRADVFYIVRPTIEMMKIISEQLREYRLRSRDDRFRFHLILCPRETQVYNKILLNNGVLGEFDQQETLTLYLMPLENDLLSMQMEHAFSDLVLERDFAMYNNIARAILQIEQLFGPIPRKQGKGTASSQVVQILQTLEQENQDTLADNPLSLISELVLIDRELDMVTPLCTPLTYEALLDEVFGIANNVIKVSPRVLEKDDTEKVSNILLTNSDSVFEEIRDLNFCVIKSLLSRKLEYIDRTYKAKDEQRTIDQLNTYLKDFKKANKEAASVQTHLYLAIHVTNETTKNPFFNQNFMCEHDIIMNQPESIVMDHIERMIGMGEDLQAVLKLLCLYSVTQNGLRSKVFDFFRKEIVQTYGFEHILTLANLEKAGLLKKQDSRSNWSSLVKNFRLINEDVNQKDPDDIAYAYAGYAPLSLRLVEALHSTGWNTDAVRNLPGEYVSAEYPVEEQRAAAKPVVLLFFVGGITFAEIAAIRFLNRQPTATRTYIIATTHILNARTLITSLSKELHNDIERSSIE